MWWLALASMIPARATYTLLSLLFLGLSIEGEKSCTFTTIPKDVAGQSNVVTKGKVR